MFICLTCMGCCGIVCVLGCYLLLFVCFCIYIDDIVGLLNTEFSMIGVGILKVLCFWSCVAGL